MDIAKKLKIEFIILCNNSVIDADTQQFSFNGVIEQINVNQQIKLPNLSAKEIPEGGIVVPINFEIISFMKKLIKEESILCEIKVELLDPDGKSIQTFVHPLNLDKKIERFRGRYKINGLKVTKSGEYKTEISIRESDGQKFGKLGEAILPVKFTWEE